MKQEIAASFSPVRLLVLALIAVRAVYSHTTQLISIGPWLFHLLGGFVHDHRYSAFIVPNFDRLAG